MLRFFAFLLVLSAGAAGCSRPAQRTLAAVEKAVAEGDAAAFRGYLSEPTLKFLRDWLGEAKVEDAAAFLMARLKAEMPLRVVGQRRDGRALIFQVTTKTGKSDLKLVWSFGAWRLDLVEDCRAWRELQQWAGKVGARMRRAAPLLGLEGPGAKFLEKGD